LGKLVAHPTKQHVAQTPNSIHPNIVPRLSVWHDIGMLYGNDGGYDIGCIGRYGCSGRND
jgi:hypothetical protein